MGQSSRLGEQMFSGVSLTQVARKFIVAIVANVSLSEISPFRRDFIKEVGGQVDYQSVDILESRNGACKEVVTQVNFCQ